MQITRLNVFRVPLAVITVIALFGACESPGGRLDTSEPIAECDGYLAAQRRCFPNSVPGTVIPDAVRAAVGDTAREKLRERCSLAMQSLANACR